MRPLTDPGLMNAHAMPVDNDEPHAQVGAHLRVSHHPALGLPVAPMVVWRAVARSRKALNKRKSVVFLDRNENPITPPFNVTPTNPVTARIVLNPGEVCIWAQLEAVPQEVLDDTPVPRRGNPFDGSGGIPRVFDGIDLSGVGGAVRDTIARAGERAGRNARGARTSGRIPGVSPIPGGPILGGPILGGPILDGPILGGPVRPDIGTPTLPFDIPDIFNPVGKLTVEAFIDGAVGPASVGSRSDIPYALSAPGIVELRITGSGRVGGLNWIELQDEQPLQWERYAVLNLPTQSGIRYISLADPESESQKRVNLQSPKREPLQETTNSPSPASAPLFNQTKERDRVKSLVPTLAADLDALINDVTPPLEQITTEVIKDENGKEVGSSTMARLHRVNQAQADPGSASYLGYKLRDDDWRETEDRIIFYHVDGFFRDTTPPVNIFDPEESTENILFKLKLERLVAEAKDLSKGTVLEILSNAVNPIPGVELDKTGQQGFLEAVDYMSLGFVAVADLAAPLDPVPAPRLTAATHKSWLPEEPPAARREVQVDVEGVRIAGTLAAGKRTPSTGVGAYETINKINDKGWHLPLVLSLNAANADGEVVAKSGAGFIADRNAAAGDIRYLLSQQDRFGRFSNWAGRTAAKGPRPKPPRPLLQAFYTQPAIGNAGTQGGQIFVKVPVPDAAGLAPGSHLLEDLVLEIDDLTIGGPPPTVTVLENTKVPSPDDPTQFFLEISQTGPVLSATEIRKVRLKARWRDTVGQSSDDSEPVLLKLTDPRPPAQPVVPDKLQYSARPDVTGLSWVEHRWTPSAGQARFGTYYTDENRLRGWLSANGGGAIVTALDAASDRAARATIFRANRALFPDHLFERLDDVGVEYASGDKGFRHGVSGSLRILNFYLIAAEAESGARPDLSGLDFIVYGVPNSDPPQRPSLTVVPAEPLPSEHDFVADIAITLPAGATLGETWRVRRSSFESDNIAKMPVVTSGAMGPLDTDTGLQTAGYRDDGPVEIAAHARLLPWKRYTWVAEVQGAPESGSVAVGKPVQGRWSRASDPVSLVLVPNAGPHAIDSVHASLSGAIVADGLENPMIRFAYPSDLTDGALGAFKLRLSRRPGAGFALEVLDEIAIAEHRVAAIASDPPDSTAFEVSGKHPDFPTDVAPSGGEFVLELVDPLGRTSPQLQIAIP